MRLIARLDIKGPNLIKSIQMEGLKVIGKPENFAHKYYHQGADEIIYIDTVASLYGRNHLEDIIKKAASNIFIPLTVGGGIRSVDDARVLLNSGADKISINSAAVKDPTLISELALKYGSQCIVLNVEARKSSQNFWEVLIENGREKTGINVLEWIKKSEELGIGEILLTSVDREGTRKGFDIDLVKEVTSITNVPIIASGGMGELIDAVEVVKVGGADSVAMADILHYDRASIRDIRDLCIKHELDVREYEE